MVSKTVDSLRFRAEEFEQDIENGLIDSHGLMMSAMDFSTMRPFQQGDFDHATVHRWEGASWNDFSEYIAYENVGMCSGALLAAMIWKYRVTKDPKALLKAYRVFEGISWLYNLSQAVAPGFFCKCYGGKLSKQTSSDQYVYIMSGLREFIEFADHTTRSRAVRMLENMVRFWMNNNYSWPYFGKDFSWPLERFPVFPWMAWHYTGKKEFHNEFKRLLELDTVKNLIPFGNGSWENVVAQVKASPAHFDFERRANARLIRLTPENSQSGLLSMEALMEHNAPARELWLDKARMMIKRDRRWIADDGYAMGFNLYHLDTDKISEIREVLHQEQGERRWRFFVGWIRSAQHSTMFARASVALNAWFPELGLLEDAYAILSKLKRENLHWRRDVSGKQYPPDLKWRDRVYSGDAVAHWLWAYWEAAAKYGTDWENSFNARK